MLIMPGIIAIKTDDVQGKRKNEHHGHKTFQQYSLLKTQGPAKKQHTY